MSSYNIDFSEPLRSGFAINYSSFNGPGGTAANTSLRLYGRNALEWGEAVNEDLVRLAENFASASPPSAPITGQIWIETSLYYRNTTIGNVLQGWYFFDVNETAPNKWKLLNGTGVVASTPAVTPAVGQYYYDNVTGTLKGYYSLGKYEPLAYVSRSFITGTGAPVSPTLVPPSHAKMWDASIGSWSAITTTFPSAAAPANPSKGMVWFNELTGVTSVFSGTAWQNVVGPSGGAATVSSGPIDMGGFKIVNGSAPTAPADLVTKQYVDTAVGGISSFLPLSGGTMVVTSPVAITINRSNATNGSLVEYKTTSGSVFAGQASPNVFAIAGLSTMSSPWFTASATAASTSGSLSVGTALTTTTTATVGTALVVGTTLTVGGAASIGGALNMSNNKVTNVQTGTNPNDAVNVQQMNSAIAASSAGAGAPVIWTSGTYKAGDIAISSGKIYIAIGGGTGGPPGGNWKQVYPAVYA